MEARRDRTPLLSYWIKTPTAYLLLLAKPSSPLQATYCSLKTYYESPCSAKILLIQTAFPRLYPSKLLVSLLSQKVSLQATLKLLKFRKVGVFLYHAAERRWSIHHSWVVRVGITLLYQWPDEVLFNCRWSFGCHQGCSIVETKLPLIPKYPQKAKLLFPSIPKLFTQEKISNKAHTIHPEILKSCLKYK